MVSNIAMFVFACALVLSMTYAIWWRRQKQELTLLNRLFLLLTVCLSTWIIPAMCMYFVDPANTSLMYLLDCLM